MDAAKIYEELDKMDRIIESINYISTSFKKEPVYYTGACFLLEDIANMLQDSRETVCKALKDN